MKTLITSLFLAVVLIGANAQTNVENTNITAPTISLTNAPTDKSSKEYGSWELTLGGAGETFHGDHSVGVDIGLSTNPFEKRPEIWVGVAQSFFWDPVMAGSTDLFVDWSQAIFPSKLNDSLYVNIGWSGGVLYDNFKDENVDHTLWRTGPEVTFEYYTSGNAFFFAGVNYDVFRTGKTEGEFRYSFGIGIRF